MCYHAAATTKSISHATLEAATLEASGPKQMSVPGGELNGITELWKGRKNCGPELYLL